MSKSRTLLSAASAAALVLGLAAPAFAQNTGTPPSTVPVPNSGTQVHCNPNGTGTVTTGPNAETSANNNVPGTPVTQNNPTGTGTTTTQTPTLQKPTSATEVQCPKTAPSTPAAPQQNAAPAMPESSGTQNMDALNNNPNGSNWLEKFNRPTVAASHKTKHTHKKRATGGGGQ